ncbi:DUF3514 domain-containing protein [Ehrlichia ruminantium]|uniref:DUF3514 domain-containing protein n=1 Tax=Ehrlichia ruminantium TaxID=779 RepID=UPI00130D4F30|nr:DUF3514 domain-containing protein [Ehrlichia ruminantium]QGR02159.1 DUF3514 domain-containing protein [Ehrlichia ruminantium]
MFGIVVSIASVVVVSTTLLGVVSSTVKNEKGEDDESVRKKSDKKSQYKNRASRIFTRLVGSEKFAKEDLQHKTDATEELPTKFVELSIQSSNVQQEIYPISKKTSVLSSKKQGTESKRISKKESLAVCADATDAQNSRPVHSYESRRSNIRGKEHYAKLGARSKKVRFKEDVEYRDIYQSAGPDSESEYSVKNIKDVDTITDAQDSRPVDSYKSRRSNVTDKELYAKLGARPKKVRFKEDVEYRDIYQSEGPDPEGEYGVKNIKDVDAITDAQDSRPVDSYKSRRSNVTDKELYAKLGARSKKVRFKEDVEYRDVYQSEGPDSEGEYGVKNIKDVDAITDAQDSRPVHSYESRRSNIRGKEHYAKLGARSEKVRFKEDVEYRDIYQSEGPDPEGEYGVKNIKDVDAITDAQDSRPVDSYKSRRSNVTDKELYAKLGARPKKVRFKEDVEYRDIYQSEGSDSKGEYSVKNIKDVDAITDAQDSRPVDSYKSRGSGVESKELYLGLSTKPKEVEFKENIEHQNVCRSKESDAEGEFNIPNVECERPLCLETEESIGSSTGQTSNISYYTVLQHKGFVSDEVKPGLMPIPSACSVKSQTDPVMSEDIGLMYLYSKLSVSRKSVLGIHSVEPSAVPMVPKSVCEEHIINKTDGIQDPVPSVHFTQPQIDQMTSLGIGGIPVANISGNVQDPVPNVYFIQPQMDQMTSLGIGGISVANISSNVQYPVPNVYFTQPQMDQMTSLGIGGIPVANISGNVQYPVPNVYFTQPQMDQMTSLGIGGIPVANISSNVQDPLPNVYFTQPQMDQMTSLGIGGISVANISGNVQYPVPNVYFTQPQMDQMTSLGIGGIPVANISGNVQDPVPNVYFTQPQMDQMASLGIGGIPVANISSNVQDPVPDVRSIPSKANHVISEGTTGSIQNFSGNISLKYVEILKKLHFSFCRHLLHEILILSDQGRIFVSSHVDKIIERVTKKVPVARFVLKASVLMQCGIIASKSCAMCRFFTSARMILKGYVFSQLLEQLVNMIEIKSNSICYYQFRLGLSYYYYKLPKLRAKHVPPSNLFYDVLDVLYNVVFDRLTRIHNKIELEILDQVIFGCTFALGSMYYSIMFPGLDYVSDNACIKLLSKAEFSRLVGRSQVCTDIDLGYMCYHIWISMFHMYDGESIGIVPYSIIPLLSKPGIDRIFSYYNAGQLNFNMFVEDIVVQVIKAVDHPNFIIVTEDIAKYYRGCNQANNQNVRAHDDKNASKDTSCDEEHKSDSDEQCDGITVQSVLQQNSQDICK